MVNMLEWISSAVSLVGSAAVVLLLAAWQSPYVARLLAAMLLSHSDSVEHARETRRKQWGVYHSAIVEKSGRPEGAE